MAGDRDVSALAWVSAQQLLSWCSEGRSEGELQHMEDFQLGL